MNGKSVSGTVLSWPGWREFEWRNDDCMRRHRLLYPRWRMNTRISTLIGWIKKREAERGTERMRRKWLRFIAFSSVLRMRRRAQAERGRERERRRKRQRARENGKEEENEREIERQTNSTNNTCAIGMNKNIYCDYLFCQRYILIYVLFKWLRVQKSSFQRTEFFTHFPTNELTRFIAYLYPPIRRHPNPLI